MLESFVVFLSQYPVTASILAVIGALRLAIKPLVSAIRVIAKETLPPKADKVVEDIFTSKTWNTVLYVLDWLTSIKLKK